MAKVMFNPMIDGITGKSGKIVFVNKSMSPRVKQSSQGYLRSHSNSSTNSIRQSNNRTAFSIITTTFNQLRQYQTAYQTWIDAANTFSTDYTVSPRSLFYSFYLAMWTGYGNGWWKPSKLIISTGFGVGSFGTGTFSNSFTNYSNLLWVNRFNAKWS